MMLTEQTSVLEAALPVSEFRDHLLLGSGFADDGLQAPVLATCLRAALAAVESESSKALLERQFKYTVSAWRDIDRLELPIAPVTSVDEFQVFDIQGNASDVQANQYRLVPDFYRPFIFARGWSLPVIPEGGTVEVLFTAGFAANWTGIPADLQQAVFMLATHFYDNRGAASKSDKVLPHGVASLLRRYRPMRILGGRS